MHERLESLYVLIDEANNADPVHESDPEGAAVPRALLYGQRMSACLERLRPDAPPELRAAARAQHICRWQIPREDYPSGREGYLRWRRDLAGHHARLTGDLMRRLDLGEASIARVQQLLQKRNLKGDADTQTLEDTACLVFLRFYFEDMRARHSDEKLIAILTRTWRKMSPQGQSAALAMNFPAPLQRLLDAALAAG